MARKPKSRNRPDSIAAGQEPAGVSDSPRAEIQRPVAGSGAGAVTSDKLSDPARADGGDTGVPAPRRKTVALALGSGGARGYAHIGAIEVLEERGYDIIAISGCSMGALIGGVYAAGRLQDYKDWVTGLGQFDVLRLLDVSFSAAGAIRGDKIFSVVRDMLGATRIEDLPLAYTAVATDLLAHKEIWFQEGPLHQAIRASVAIPSVVTPVVLNGRILVDGALLNPLPIIPTISSHADLIFAVNLSGEDDQQKRLADAVFAEQAASGETESDLDEWVDRVRGKASRWLDWDLLRSFGRTRESGDAPPHDDTEEKLEKEARRKQLESEREKPAQQAPEAAPETISWEKLGIGKFDIMNLTIETMQSALVQYKLAGYPPDLLVNVPKNACRSYDYHKAPEMIQLGRERMAAALDRFEETRTSSGILSV